MSNPKKRAAEEAPSSKRAKKKKPNFQDNEALDADLGVNTLFARMDNQLLADHFAQKLSRFGGDLSSVEVSDLTVSGKYLSLVQDFCSVEVLMLCPSQCDSGYNLVAGEQDSRQAARLLGTLFRGL